MNSTCYEHIPLLLFTLEIGDDEHVDVVTSRRLGKSFPLADSPILNIIRHPKQQVIKHGEGVRHRVCKISDIILTLKLK